MKRYVFATLIGVILVVGCGREADPALTYDPGLRLATVNGEPVYEELFEETYANFLSRTGFSDTPRQRYYHLNTIIDMYLLYEEAERRGLNDEILEDYRHRTRMRTLRNQFLKNEFLEGLPMPEDAETRLAFYRTKQNPYVRQLFFLDEAKAHRYYERLEAGEDFVDLANELYRTVSYDSLAGYLGEISYFGVDDVFAETAYTLNAGEYSKPVRTRQGFVIIRVDNWNFNPIVTETAYINQREKTRYFLYQRNYAIGADQFIREYMSGLNPQPNLENLDQVQQVIRRNMPDQQEQMFLPQPVIREDQLVGIHTLDPMMPLVTYTVGDETQAFRLKDYLLWIDTLPYQEVMFRFDASVGRALMWDVFAKQSVAKGYDRNPFVDFNANAASRFFQASRVQQMLQFEPAKPVTEEDLSTAFDVFGMATLKESRATYWVIPTASNQEAMAVRDSITEDPASIVSVPGARFMENVDVHEAHPQLSVHVLRAIKDMPFVVSPGTDWYVIKVLGRELTYHTLESRREEVKELLQPSYNEFVLLRELRQQAAIRVDTLAFEKLMHYYPN